MPDIIEPVNRIFLQRHEPIDFTFQSSPQTFFVDEIAAKPFSKKGNTLILHIKKVRLSTWELIDILSEQASIPKHLIGYAGLKDKHATTTQYISVPKSFEREIKKFSHPLIEILTTSYHSAPIQMGELKGNRFTITLTGIEPAVAGKLEKAFKKIASEGLANYFGYQRFGIKYEAVLQGKQIVEEDTHMGDKRLRKFLISAYSSHLFNAWLYRRIELSLSDYDPSAPFRLFKGDLFIDLKSGKSFIPNNPQRYYPDILAHKVVPTGAVSGRNIPHADADALAIEKEFFDIAVTEKGIRRPALVFAGETSFKYDFQSKSVTLGFTLPKSSYATVLLEALGQQSLAQF